MNINDKSNLKPYAAQDNRYDNMRYRRSGASGIQLPEISLGLWHNFGHKDDLIRGRDILRTAFDHGIVHFDLANNYGPPYGSAEINVGQVLKEDFSAHRDELLIATKAGYDMWPGPYGNFGSKKYLVNSIDQSLKRLQLDYVDVFYHHRPDPDTPLEETMNALDHIVRSGKALYAAISNYNAEDTKKAVAILKALGTPCLMHQARYSMFDRWVEDGLLTVLDEEKVGCIVFSPLAQGMLTNKYLHGVPDDSRAAKPMTYLNKETIEEKLPAIQALHQIAEGRGQKLSQLAITWLLSNKTVTSVLVGASSSGQLLENLKACESEPLTQAELAKINEILNNQ